MILWGGWALVTWATFSFASGIIHQYYAIALAPALAALVAIGSVLLWRRRDNAAARWTLAGTLAVTSGYAMWLLVLAARVYSLLGAVTVALGLSAAVPIGLGITNASDWRHRRRGGDSRGPDQACGVRRPDSLITAFRWHRHRRAQHRRFARVDRVAWVAQGHGWSRGPGGPGGQTGANGGQTSASAPGGAWLVVPGDH